MHARTLLLLFTLLVVPVVAAQTSIPVLSVVENNASDGGVADVHLTVRSGTGAVYIDSYPLTRLDTQLSARFAREYACSLAAKDCSKLDFFFVIRARSTIIGGPSAGAAMTVAAYTELEDLTLREDMAMTGTIGSGGIIGPVGGTPAKVRAARDAGFDTVLVSALENDPTVQAEGVDVIPVVDVEEAIWHFTGHDPRPPTPPLVVPEEYTSTMGFVSEQLCERAHALVNQSEENVTTEYLDKAALASGRGEYYTAASFCFSAALEAREALVKRMDADARRSLARQLVLDVERADQELPEDLDTLADLEVYMIVRERLLDAFETAEDELDGNLSASGLGYAVERFYSAQAWSVFFDAIPSEPVDLSDEELRSACWRRLAEAEERLNYVSYITSLPLSDSRQQVDNAYEYERQEEWALCLFTATKARAEADSVIGAVYAGDDLNATIGHKLNKTHTILSRAASERGLPLLSYSYFEYAQSLEDAYSKNLYAEYALALAHMDVFFPRSPYRPGVNWSRVWVLLAGLVVGFTAGVLAWEGRVRLKRK